MVWFTRIFTALGIGSVVKNPFGKDGSEQGAGTSNISSLVLLVLGVLVVIKILK